MSGKYFEDLEVGQRIQHPRGRTVTEMDNVLFSALTMNTQPLHLDEEFSKQTQFGQRIVHGLFTTALVVGISVPDLTEGTIVANLGYDKVRASRSGLSRRYDPARKPKCWRNANPPPNPIGASCACGRSGANRMERSWWNWNER